MSEILPQELNCIGCSKIPEDEVLQCITNHIFCPSCASSVHFCPKCVFQIGEIRSLEVTPVDREFYCPFKSKGCAEVLPQKNIKHHLRTCQFGGEDVNVCKFLGYQCEKLVNTRNPSQILEHLQQQHNVVSNAGKLFEVDLMDVPKYDHYRGYNATWAPTIINTKDQHLIIAAYIINGAISFTCLSLEDISENFLVEFKLVAKSNEVSDFKWVISPTPITEAKSGFQVPKLAILMDVLHKYYQVDGGIRLKICIHGDHFPVKTNLDVSAIIKLPIIHENPVYPNTYSVLGSVEVNNNVEVIDTKRYSVQDNMIAEQINGAIMNSRSIPEQTQNQVDGITKAIWFPCFVGVGLGCALTLAMMAALKIKYK